MWPNPESQKLHFVFVYIGPSANEQVDFIAANVPDSTVEKRELDDLRWTHACVSPRSLRAIDGMKCVLHLEAYEGHGAAKRARLENADAVCVIHPADSLVPFLHTSVVRERAIACGRDWDDMTVMFQSAGEIGPRVFDTLTAMTRVARRSYRAGRVRGFVLPLVVAPSPLEIDRDDLELHEACDHANRTLESFVAKLRAPGKTREHAIQTCLRGEHVWIKKPRWNGTHFVGTLDNGESIRVAATEVQDWMYIENDEIRGGYTIRVLAERAS